MGGVHMKNLTFLFLFALLLLPVVNALPEPTIINQADWVITQDTESDYFGFEIEKNTQQTQICVLSESATKLNDLPIHFTYTNLETNETEQLNRYRVKQTDSGLDKDYYGFCRNFHTEKRIKFGNNSIIYEWINNTIYIYNTDKLDIDPFEIEILCNDVKLESPDISFISNEPIEAGVKFSANVDNFTCNGKLTFRQNKLIESNVIFDNQFGAKVEETTINYDDFINSELNNITSQNISYVYPSLLECIWDESIIFVSEIRTCLKTPKAYNQNYFGTFTEIGRASCRERV